MPESLAEYKAHMHKILRQFRGVEETLDIKAVLAANLRALMEHRKEKQQAVAKRAGVDQTTISRALRRTHATQIDKLHLIAQAFDLHAWQLLVPGLDATAPPVLRMTTARERETLSRLEKIAEELAELKNGSVS